MAQKKKFKHNVIAKVSPWLLDSGMPVGHTGTYPSVKHVFF